MFPVTEGSVTECLLNFPWLKQFVCWSSSKKQRLYISYCRLWRVVSWVRRPNPEDRINHVVLYQIVHALLVQFLMTHLCKFRQECILEERTVVYFWFFWIQAPGSEALTSQPFAHAGKKLNREVTPLRRESVVTLVKWKVKRDENYVVFQVYIE